ncbi:MAG: glycosyl hydrolase 53 family protein [Prevotella sp.]|nr:glycosyl hydrolase 53 family protein [Prevotella sp.]
MMKRILLLPLLLFAMLTASAEGVGKYVGGDISLLPQYEKAGDVYLDGNGQAIPDLITWLVQDCGWNTFRVRLFVNPNRMGNDGKSIDPAVCQDLDYVTALGKRIKAAGAKFMLDFHYSDTWVDATHIQAPAAWKGLSDAAMAQKLGEYTTDCLKHLNANSATPDFVQVGNEIMYGLCDIKVAPYDRSGDNWTGYLGLLKAGCNAVRAQCPKAQIIIHTDRPSNSGYNTYYYNKLINGGVDFDVIGLSYYPFWHENLSKLKLALNSLATTFPSKKVQIVESAYYFQYWPSSGINYDTRSIWPASVDGQYKFVKDLLDALKNYPQVEGYSYWFPEEAGCGYGASDWTGYTDVVLGAWVNRGLWWPGETTKKEHWPLKAEAGMVQYLMKDFLSPGESGITNAKTAAKSGAATVRTVTDGQHIYIEKADGQRYTLEGKQIR